tara:strand:+ start:506 stop:946 length:441 start_codon:yes stop_codon:yes gene_type:complete
MITPLTQITGDKELDRALKELGKTAIKDSLIKKSLKKLAKPIINDIRGNINNVTGNLSKSIGIIKGIRGTKGAPFIIIGPRYYGNFKGYHAHLVEVGKSFYNVNFEDQRIIERAYNKNKTKTQEELKREMLILLRKEMFKKLGKNI